MIASDATFWVVTSPGAAASGTRCTSADPFDTTRATALSSLVKTVGVVGAGSGTAWAASATGATETCRSATGADTEPGTAMATAPNEATPAISTDRTETPMSCSCHRV